MWTCSYNFSHCDRQCFIIFGRFDHFVINAEKLHHITTANMVIPTLQLLAGLIIVIARAVINRWLDYNMIACGMIAGKLYRIDRLPQCNEVYKSEANMSSRCLCCIAYFDFGLFVIPTNKILRTQHRKNLVQEFEVQNLFHMDLGLRMFLKKEYFQPRNAKISRTRIEKILTTRNAKIFTRIRKCEAIFWRFRNEKFFNANLEKKNTFIEDAQTQFCFHFLQNQKIVMLNLQYWKMAGYYS